MGPAGLTTVMQVIIELGDLAEQSTGGPREVCSDLNEPDRP